MIEKYDYCNNKEKCGCYPWEIFKCIYEYPFIPLGPKGYQGYFGYHEPRGYIVPPVKQVPQGVKRPPGKFVSQGLKPPGQITPYAVPKPTGVQNLLDGNNVASLRGINCPDRSYKMGQGAVALGINTKASGFASHAEGALSIASGLRAHAEGYKTEASGEISHAEGSNTIANGIIAHAEGSYSISSGIHSHAEGNNTTASGNYSHAEGNKTEASGGSSHAEGNGTIASSTESHAEGFRTTASGFASHAEGAETVASERGSHAEGAFTEASGLRSHAEGSNTTASGEDSHAEGSNTLASGIHSHAEGSYSIASGIHSHAEGNNTTASGNYSHAEGNKTEASGGSSHAEGNGTIASSTESHAEGFRTTASGFASHAEGAETVASEGTAHAEGAFTTASGKRSHAEGFRTNTNNYDGAHIMGKYGFANAKYSWFLANGNSAITKGLAAKILGNGNAYIDVAWHGGGADYAEMFETYDGKSIDVGYFVTLNGASDKIRIANASDEYILGVTSVNSVVLGDSGELRWKDKYITDKWGRIKYETVTIPEEKDIDGNVIISKHKEIQPILNPKWNNEIEYIPRSRRPEWVSVGLLGKILIRDDGTCKPGGYCKPNIKGIATACNTGYRVLKRINNKQVLILYR